jgi:predicted lipid-binding transport protein (Tim44 family)
MDPGPEARAYADHYILVHMNEASDGRSYSEVSGEFVQLSDEAKASADGQALGQLRQTLFMGSTLRGLLLYGAAFATMGTIAGIGAIVAFVAGGGLLVLVGLGFWHARRAEQTAERAVPTRAVPQPV